MGGAKVCAPPYHVDRVTDEGGIYYQHDTELGSSGAPIFDNVGRLVGIHAHGGRDSNGGCLLVNVVAHAKSRPKSLKQEIVQRAGAGYNASNPDHVAVDEFGSVPRERSPILPPPASMLLPINTELSNAWKNAAFPHIMA